MSLTVSARTYSLRPFLAARSHFFWALFMSVMLFCPLRLQADFSIVAHRGGYGGPENTVTNAIRAFEAGADIVEIDLRSTADGVLVNFHDATLDRTTTGSGNLKDKTWEELQTYDAGIKFGAQFAGERIPSFTEMIRISNIYQKKIFVDLKEADLAEKIRRDLSLMEGSAHNLIFVTWGYDNEVYRDLFPHSEQMAIAGGVGTDYSSDSLTQLKKLGVTGLFFWGNRQSAESIRHLHAHGMKCGVISGGPADIQEMIDTGLDYLSTDYVAPTAQKRKATHWEKWINQYSWIERPLDPLSLERRWWDTHLLPHTDYDEDEQPLIVEFACGTNAFLPSTPVTQVIKATAQEITIECPVTELGLCEMLISPLVSTNLTDWQNAPIAGLSRLPNGRCAWKIRREPAGEAFYKLGFRLR
jgi:glycerophosphoryl diester phosphodiesterase